jgi:hypothetical protein
VLLGVALLLTALPLFRPGPRRPHADDTPADGAPAGA